MKHARIAELKARLSEYLRAVRRGETVTVLDRDTPVARIIPIRRIKILARVAHDDEHTAGFVAGHAASSRLRVRAGRPPDSLVLDRAAQPQPKWRWKFVRNPRPATKVF